MIIEQIKDIKESELYRQADIRNNNEINCTKCGKLINYAYITTGEAICERCYLKIVEKRGEELKKRIDEVGEIDFSIRTI